MTTLKAVEPVDQDRRRLLSTATMGIALAEPQASHHNRRPHQQAARFMRRSPCARKEPFCLRTLRPRR